MLVSIIIVNYNYGAYLRQTIDSALNQSYPEIEVIVVDDGSSDDSRVIIEEYRDRLHPLFKENSGQISSANVGKQLARGEIVVFLDSDDVLYEDTVARHVEHFLDPDVIISQGVMEAITPTSDALGYVVPRNLSPTGDYEQRFLRHGPAAYNSGFTSACAWRGSLLDRVFPLPKEDVPIIGPDGYLSSVAPLFGKIASLEAPVGEYRVHDGNRGPFGYTFDRKFLESRAVALQQRMDFAKAWATELGYDVDNAQWQSRSGWRFNLGRHALALLKGETGVSPIQLAVSPFRGPGPNTAKSAAISALLFFIGVLPQPLSLGMSKRTLDKAWGKKKQI